MKSGESSTPQEDDHSPQTSEPTDFGAELAELSLHESGIGFVYAALDLLSTHYQLSDAILTVEGDSIGSQIFRLRGNAVSADEAAQRGGVPGLFCVPNSVPDVAREALYEACQRTLSQRLVRHNLKDEAPAPLHRYAPSAGRKTISDSHASLDSDSNVTNTSRVRDHRQIVELIATWNARTIISMSLLLLDLVTLAMTMGNIHGPSRFVLGLLLGVVTPGWSVVGLLKLRNAALEVGLSIAGSLAIIMVAGQMMLTLNLWHPVAFEELTCVICAPFLVWHARDAHRVQRPLR